MAMVETPFQEAKPYDIKESDWWKTNVLFQQRPSTGFVLNDVLALHEELGFVKKAWSYQIFNLAKFHPERSNAQLKAMYLCRWKHSVDDKGYEQWSRTDEDQIAAAEEVAREENSRLASFVDKHPAMAGEVHVIQQQRLSLKGREEDLVSGMDLLDHLEAALANLFDPATELDKVTALRDKVLRAEREAYEAKMELQRAEQEQREVAKKKAKQQRKQQRMDVEAALQLLEQKKQQEKEQQRIVAEQKLQEELRERELEQKQLREREEQQLRERELEQRQQREREEQQSREREEQQLREKEQHRKQKAKKSAKKSGGGKIDEEEAALEAAIMEVQAATAAAAALKEEQNKKEAAASSQQQRVDRADAALAQLQKRPKIYMPKHDIAPLPNRMAIYSFMLCCSMRENLMLNILAAYGAWVVSISSIFPPYNDLRTIFTVHANTGLVVPPQKPLFKNSSPATTGFVRIVQSLRNIVGVVFDLSHILLTADIFVFNNKFQLLYSICNLRQFSMLMLEGMEALTESGHPPCPKLLELYKRVSAFEQFVQGPDFSMLCMCLPRPVLPAATPAPYIPAFPKSCPRDILASLHLISNMEIVLHDLPAEWQTYKNLCGPILGATKKLWLENGTYLKTWGVGKDVPDLGDIYDQPGSREMAAELFGGSADFFLSLVQQTHGNSMERAWQYIEVAGKSFNHDAEQECILAFVLSPSILESWAVEHEYQPIHTFPFPLTIHEVRFLIPFPLPSFFLKSNCALFSKPSSLHLFSSSLLLLLNSLLALA